MPTPRLSLEALVDLVLKSGKIDESQLVRKIESTLKKTQLPPLSIRPQFEIEGKAFEKALKRKDVIRSLDEQLAIVKGKASRIQTELQSAVTAQLPKGVTLGVGKEGKAIEARLKAASDAAHAQLLAQEQILSLAHDSERALQSFANSPAGKNLPQNLELIRKLQAGQTTRAKLEASGQLQAVRETTAFLELRAKHLDEIVRRAGKLGQEIRSIEGEYTDAGTGKQVTGTEQARGLPVHLPDLAAQSKELKRLAKDTDLALDTTKAERYQRQIEGITTKLGDATKGFRAFTNGLKTFEGTEVFQPLRAEMDGVKSGIDEIRSEFKKAQAISEFGPKADRINELYRDLEKRERGIAEVRDKLDAATAKRRDLALGRYLKNFREITATTTAQAEAAQGRVLLKGARTPDTLVPKITNVQEGRNVMRALQAEIVSTTDKMEKFSASARAAGKETSESFERAGRKLIQLEQLHESAAQKTRELFRAGTSEGQQAAAKKERTLGVDYRKQLGQIEDVNTQLGEVAKRLQDPKLRQVDLSQPTDEMERLSKRAGELRSSLGSIVGTEDLVERGKLSKALGDELGLLGKEVTRFSKATRKQISESVAGFDEAARQRSIAAGQQVIRSLGEQPDFTQVGNVGKLTDAVSALEDSHNRAKAALKEYDAAAQGVVNTEDKRRQGLQSTIATQKTLLTDAKAALAAVTVEPTQKGIKQLGDSIDTIGTRTSNAFRRAQKGIDDFNNELLKLGKRDDFEQLRSQADLYQERLKRLRQDQANLSTEPTTMVENQAKDLQNAARRLEQAIGDLRQIPREAAAKDVQARLDEIARTREDYVARQEAARRGRSEVDRVSREAQRGNLPGGIAPVVLTAQTTALERQLDVMQHIRAESERLNSYEEQRLATARKFGGEQGELKAIERIRKQRRALDEAEQTLIGRGEVQFPPREVQRAPLTDAQVEAARRAYGINVRDLEQMRAGLRDLKSEYQNRIDDILARREKLQGQLTKGGAEANAEYQKLGKQLPLIQRDLGLVTRESERLTKASDALAQLTTPEAVRRTLLTRSIEGLRIVDQAGGPAALARSLRGIRGEDRARLPLVHETLTQQLGFTQARLDTLAAQPGGRATEEFKQASTEAKNLQSAISRVNGELRGYTKLTTQLGGLARQFVRYGIGYAALYQVLGGVRQLISGITDLDSALVSIQAVTQTTDQQMRIIEGSIKRVAIQTRFTTNEIAQAGQVLAQAGVVPQDFPSALSATAQFASATESSIQVSADLVSTMRNVFTELSDLDIANQLTRAVNISKLTAEDLKTILSLSAQTARGYNLTSEQYLAAVTTLRNAGIKASTVATGLRQALIEIFAPDSKSIKVLSERYAQVGEKRTPEEIRQRFFRFNQSDNPALGVLRELRRLGFTGSGKATFAGRTFDVRAENVIKALITNLEEFTRSQTQVSFGNAAVAGAQQQLEAINASFANLGAAIIATTHSLTENLLPSIEDVIDGMTDAVVSLGELDAKLKAESGTSIGTAATSGALAFALSAATTPNNFGFAKSAGRNILAGSLGGYAAAKTQEIAGENGLGQTAAGILGALSSILTTLVLFVGNPIKKLKGIGSLIKDFPAAMSLAFEGGVSLKGFSDAMGALFTTGGLKKLGSKLLAIGKAHPILRFLGLAAGVFGLIKAYTGDGAFKEAEAKLQQAEKNATNARAERQLLEEQAKQLTPSSETYTAGPETIAGQTELLRGKYDDVQAHLALFFDKAGKDMDKVRDIIRQMEDVANEEGTPARIDLLKKLQDYTSHDLKNSFQDRNTLEQIQSLLAETDAFAAGLATETTENYRRFAEQRAKLAGTVQGAQYGKLGQVAEANNLVGELNGTIESTSESVLTLMESWIGANKQIEAQINELIKRREAEIKAEEVAQSAYFATVAAAKSKAEIDRVVRENFVAPQTETEAARVNSRIAAGKDLAAERTARAQQLRERAASTTDRRSTVAQNKAAAEAEALAQKYLDANTVMQQLLDAGIGVSEKQLEARQKEIAANLQTFQTLQNQRKLSPAVDTALRLRKGDPSTAGLYAQYVQALKDAKGNTDEAAKILVKGDREAGHLTKINEPPGLRAFATGIEDINTNRNREIATSRSQQLTYLQGEEARRRGIRISQLDQEIREAEHNKRYADLEGKLAERKKLLIAQIDGEIAFEGKKKEEAISPAQKATHQGRIDKLIQDRANAEFQYSLEINDANRKDVELRQKQLQVQLRNLKILTENTLNTTQTVDYEKLKEYGDRYAESMDKLVEATYEYARITHLNAAETQDAVDAVKTGALSLRELIAQYGNVIVASQNYVRAVTALTAPAATTKSTDLNQEIVRRQRGIPVPADERIKRAEATLPLLRKELDRRKRNRDENLQLYADLVARGRPEQELNAALANAAQAEEGVQSLIDRIVELRKQVQASSLNMGDALRDAFDPEAIFGEFRRRAEESIYNLGNDIRNIMGDTFDGVASDFADALFHDLPDGKSFSDQLKDTLTQGVKDAGKTAVEAYFKSGAIKIAEAVAPGSTKPDENGNVNPLLKLLGLASPQPDTYDTIEINGKTVVVNGLIPQQPVTGNPYSPDFVGPQLPETDPRSPFFVGPQSPFVPGSPNFVGPPAPVRPSYANPKSGDFVGPPAPPGLGENADQAKAAAEEETTGFFTTIKEGFLGAAGAIGDGFTALGGSISKLFGGGETGKYLSGALSFFAKDGAVVKAKDGKVLKANSGVSKIRRSMHLGDGGLLKGPGTATSDSIPGIVVDKQGKVVSGLAVSDGEAILNAKAVQALGAETINFLNKNAARFASGGIVTSSPRLQTAAASVSASSASSRPVRQPAVDLESLAAVINDAQSGRAPQSMKLEVSEGALNRTLRDYVERHFADVIARR